MLSLLSNVRILDLCRLIPGAYATSKLADMGADVIKVEFPPNGDYIRRLRPLHGSTSLYHQILNRNKRSVVLDLGTAEGRTFFENLVRTSDVIIESGRPAGTRAMRADYESVREIKPDIVYCSLSGYGQDGPYSNLPSHGANLEASAGLIGIQERADGTADVPNIRTFVASQAGGLHAAMAILAALQRRHATGQGAYLDVCGFDAAVSWQYLNLACLANLGELFAGSEGFGPRYGCYRTQDRRWLFFAAIEPKFWRQFCAAAGRPELADRVDDTRLVDYGDDDEPLRAVLAEIIAGRSQADWLKLAVEQGLPLSPVNTAEDLLADGHVQARGMLMSGSNSPVKMVGLPIKVLGESFAIARAAPEIGQHTAELARESATALGA
jgi:crotonobetainyl-CoA:carnitine CoA-transferase CaiB-like acyl-CoA transferase